MKPSAAITPRPLTAPHRRSLQMGLLQWFAEFQRPLPWRQTTDPYAIWLSEVMLQQTQVATVIPYYRRFLAALPDIPTLAQADIQTVLALWAGLGYYRRAHQLHAAAKQIVAHHGGKLPADFLQLLKLPGFGPYTAGAVASIAFHQCVPAVDGNVLRVASRILADDRDIRAASVHKSLRTAVGGWVVKENAGQFNQALMELGATVCSVTSPRCDMCPVRPVCRARAAGRQMDFPVRRRPKAKRTVHLAALHIRDAQGKYLLAQRQNGALWAGLWELPAVPIAVPPHTLRPIIRLARRTLGLEISSARSAARVAAVIEHVLTHMHVYVYIFNCSLRTAQTSPHAARSPAVRPHAARLPAAHPLPPDSPYQALAWLADPARVPLSTLARKQFAAVSAASSD